MTQYVVPNTEDVCASLNIPKPVDTYPYVLIRYISFWDKFELIRGTSRKNVQVFLNSESVLTLGLLPKEAKKEFLTLIRQEAKKAKRK